MSEKTKFVVSHAPFWQDGATVAGRNTQIMLALAPAALVGMARFGPRAFTVLAFSMATAMAWELVMNKLMRRPISIGDGNAMLMGLLLGMMLPAAAPWWLVLVGSFMTIVVGKMIYGGLGGNPFHPVAVGLAVLYLSWPERLNFDAAMVNFDLSFPFAHPIIAVKLHGAQAAAQFSAWDMLLGRQMGGIGSIFGLGLMAGGLYLMLRGIIRWEVSISFLAGIALTSYLFHMFGKPGQYTGPVFNLLAGYTLIGAFFLATEDSSSPVNFGPMLLFGVFAGVMTILIRNLAGAKEMAVVFAVLLAACINPLLDMIRPKALGKAVDRL